MSEVQFTIHEKKDMPLLSRQMVTLVAEYSGATPARTKIREQVCSFLKAPLDVCVIKSIYTAFGSRRATVVVHLYKTADDAKRFEQAHVYAKQTGKVKKAAAAAAS